MTTEVPNQSRRARAAGALIGSAVGDALGAPFEFGPPGAFSARFPAGSDPALQMCGGRGWAQGEFTDDTQMALVVAGSLLDNAGLDEPAMFARFVAWCTADPPDVGDQTRAVLTSGLPWSEAARAHADAGHHAAGNGSLMRTTPAALFFAASGREATMDAARRISALTHGDPAAGEGCAIFHELIRASLDGGSPLAAIPNTLTLVSETERAKWATVLDPSWHPELATESNGAVWPTLGSAVWALRTTDSFEKAVRAAVDLGHDTDTVACVTGALAGAVYGATAIPRGWSTNLNGTVPGHGDRVWRTADLERFADELSSGRR